MEALMAFGAAFIIFAVVLEVFMIVALWFVFEKAGEPGWAAIIPIYNLLILIKIAGKEWWWIFGVLVIIIPFVGWILFLVWAILLMHGLSKNFGKEAGFTVGLVLLGFVFLPILAFGDAKFNAVAASKEPVPEAPVVEEAAPEAPAQEEAPEAPVE